MVMKKLTFLFVFSTLVIPVAVLAQTVNTPYFDPNCTPPACNVAAPINVGSSLQDKAGSFRTAAALVSNGLFTYLPSTNFVNAIKNLAGYFGPGATEDGKPGAGKVLSSVDANGNSFWVSLSALCSSTGACGGTGLPNGTAFGQTLYWNASKWTPNSEIGRAHV